MQGLLWRSPITRLRRLRTWVISLPSRFPFRRDHAKVFGRLTLDPEWLQLVVGVSADATDQARRALAQRRRVNLLVFARWVLVMTHFERGLYADPDADHDTLWWDLVERFQLLHRPDDRLRAGR